MTKFANFIMSEEEAEEIKFSLASNFNDIEHCLKYDWKYQDGGSLERNRTELKFIEEIIKKIGKLTFKKEVSK